MNSPQRRQSQGGRLVKKKKKVGRPPKPPSKPAQQGVKSHVFADLGAATRSLARSESSKLCRRARLWFSVDLRSSPSRTGKICTPR
jgi:hypothetical protein